MESWSHGPWRPQFACHFSKWECSCTSEAWVQNIYWFWCATATATLHHGWKEQAIAGYLVGDQCIQERAKQHHGPVYRIRLGWLYDLYGTWVTAPSSPATPSECTPSKERNEVLTQRLLSDSPDMAVFHGASCTQRVLIYIYTLEVKDY